LKKFRPITCTTTTSIMITNETEEMIKGTFFTVNFNQENTGYPPFKK